MKVLFCTLCHDIRAFENYYTACRCGNMEARWLDPVRGTVQVRAKSRPHARIIGMNNQMLGHALQLANSLYKDYGAAKWKEFHDQATDAPGYVFDKGMRSCWACIVGIGSTSDITWDPEQPDFDENKKPFIPTVSPEHRLRTLQSLYKDVPADELHLFIEKQILGPQ